jgi:hypothetical protein
MPPDSEKEVHALIVRQIEGLGTRMDGGFAEIRGQLQARCEGIIEEINVVRTEFNDRILNHKGQVSQDIRAVHARIDNHLDDHASQDRSKGKRGESGHSSSGHLPAGEVTLTGTAKMCGKIAAIGTVVAGLLWLVKVIHDALQAGVLK